MTELFHKRKSLPILVVVPLIFTLGACSTTDQITFGPHATAGYGSSSPASALPSPIASSPYRYSPSYSPYERGRSLQTRGAGGP